ncbi:aldo/keto reductase [Streptomyces litchfieldiae]|uniref:Aldo/keto reductase n=1 Tax=Streptomyces litchfieldiae TaxID=3075543 RepID=A0ABU2MY23_9ACTN|nr:aldo/keto reductase [Streptomyces sp. DSM 44938]MDT0346411.1 aldo/keto reductase [Streptomyces sp. DSM 44938]
MRTTTLADGRTCGAIGLGCMSMSHSYSPMERDDAESIEVINRAVDLGITFFDTADMYGPFTNERLLGLALGSRRDEVLVATKCGLLAGPDGRLRRDARPEYIRAACDASLKRLGTDVIDLYQLHRVDPAVPLEESWGAMAELVREGKVRALGISHPTVEELERARAVFPVTAVQHELSVWASYTREDVLPWCRKNAVTFLAFAPLGRGFLTGRLPTAPFPENDSRSRDPRFAKGAMAENQAIVTAIRMVAERHEATPAQVALAWVLAQGEGVLPIPGTKKIRWLEENAAATELTLSQEDLEDLDAMPPPAGHRRWV